MDLPPDQGELTFSLWYFRVVMNSDCYMPLVALLVEWEYLLQLLSPLHIYLTCVFDSRCQITCHLAHRIKKLRNCTQGAVATSELGTEDMESWI